MKKIVITGGASVPFSEIETEMPAVSGFDILVEVKAGSVNPVDTKIRANYSGTAPKVLGFDGAGIVTAVGELVREFRPGDSVYYSGDMTRDGSNSSFQIVDSRIAAVMPSGSFEQAAAVPLAALTAYESLFDRMGITANSSEPVLIINGAGGVGSMAIQLLKAKTACTVIVTASRSESQAWCRELGADHVADHSRPLKEQLEEIGIHEVPSIFNCADSTLHLKNCADLIAPQGKICWLVDFREPVDMNLFKRKSVSLIWEFMFTRTLFKTADLARQGEILRECADLISAGKMRSPQRVSLGGLSVETISESHRLIAEGRTIGKITWHA